jgi:hypothetical protein
MTEPKLIPSDGSLKEGEDSGLTGEKSALEKLADAKQSLADAAAAEAGMSQWVGLDIQALLSKIEGLDEVFEKVKKTLDTVKAFVDIVIGFIKFTLELAILLIDITAAAIKVLIEVVDEIITLLSTPAAVRGLSIPLHNGTNQSIYNKFSASLYDSEDPWRPMFSPDQAWAGAVLVYGVSDYKALIEMVDQLLNFKKLFGDLFKDSLNVMIHPPGQLSAEIILTPAIVTSGMFEPMTEAHRKLSKGSTAARWSDPGNRFAVPTLSGGTTTEHIAGFVEEEVLSGALSTVFSSVGGDAMPGTHHASKNSHVSVALKWSPQGRGVDLLHSFIGGTLGPNESVTIHRENVWILRSFTPHDFSEMTSTAIRALDLYKVGTTAGLFGDASADTPTPNPYPHGHDEPHALAKIPHSNWRGLAGSYIDDDINPKWITNPEDYQGGGGTKPRRIYYAVAYEYSSEIDGTLSPEASNIFAVTSTKMVDLSTALSTGLFSEGNQGTPPNWVGYAKGLRVIPGIDSAIQSLKEFRVYLKELIDDDLEEIKKQLEWILEQLEELQKAVSIMIARLKKVIDLIRAMNLSISTIAFVGASGGIDRFNQKVRTALLDKSKDETGLDSVGDAFTTQRPRFDSPLGENASPHYVGAMVLCAGVMGPATLEGFITLLEALGASLGELDLDADKLFKKHGLDTDEVTEKGPFARTADALAEEWTGWSDDLKQGNFKKQGQDLFYTVTKNTTVSADLLSVAMDALPDDAAKEYGYDGTDTTTEDDADDNADTDTNVDPRAETDDDDTTRDCN